MRLKDFVAHQLGYSTRPVGFYWFFFSFHVFPKLKPASTGQRGLSCIHWEGVMVDGGRVATQCPAAALLLLLPPLRWGGPGQRWHQRLINTLWSAICSGIYIKVEQEYNKRAPIKRESLLVSSSLVYKKERKKSVVINTNKSMTRLHNQKCI